MALETFDGVKNILISDCIVDENNLYQMRQQYKPEIISAIKTSLENGKLFQPIAVTLSEDKEHYIIVDGTHRFKAASELEWKEIQATYLSEDEAKDWGLKANILRNDYNAVEKAQALLKLKEKNGISKNVELANLVGLKKSMVSKYLKINTLPEEIKNKAAKVDYFSYQKLYALANNKKMTDEEKVTAFDEMYALYNEETGQKNPKHREKSTEAKINLENFDNAISKMKDTVEKYLDAIIIDDKKKKDIIAKAKTIKTNFETMRKMIEDLETSESETTNEE